MKDQKLREGLRPYVAPDELEPLCGIIEASDTADLSRVLVYMSGIKAGAEIAKQKMAS